MTDFFSQQPWLIIALIFFGVIFYISWIRWRDRKYIEQRFSGNPVLAMSFGVNYFGRVTEKGAPRRNSGFLLLLSDRLFYRSRVASVELEVPLTQITRVYHDRGHKGVDLHQSVVKIDFLTDKDERDSAAFKVPYPPQWIAAIENKLDYKKKESG